MIASLRVEWGSCSGAYSSKTVPLRFAWYMATSARRSRPAASEASSGATATPMLPDTSSDNPS